MDTILVYLNKGCTALINKVFKHSLLQIYSFSSSSPINKIDLIFSNGIIIQFEIPSLIELQSSLNIYDEKAKPIEGAFNLYFELIKKKVHDHYPELINELGCVVAKTWREAGVHFREEFEKLDYELNM